MTLRTWIDLTPHEQFVALVRPSLWSSFPELVAWFCLLLVPAGLFGPLFAAGWGGKIAWIVLVLVLAGWARARWKRFLRTALVITTHRLRVVRARGWFEVRAKATDYPLHTLMQIDVPTSSWRLKFLKSGTLRLTQTETVTEIRHVTSPQRVAACLVDLKHRNGVLQ